MKRRKPTLDVIDRRLTQAERLLGVVAGALRDAGFAPRRNIRRIGEALANITDIQFEICAVRPDLLPDYLADTKFGKKVLSRKSLGRAGRTNRLQRRGGSRSLADRQN